jgi:hypothetical protein
MTLYPCQATYNVQHTAEGAAWLNDRLTICYQLATAHRYANTPHNRTASITSGAIE